eukprot:4055058-Prymnesium_polylepis.1
MEMKPSSRQGERGFLAPILVLSLGKEKVVPKVVPKNGATFPFFSGPGHERGFGGFAGVRAVSAVLTPFSPDLRWTPAAINNAYGRPAPVRPRAPRRPPPLRCAAAVRRTQPVPNAAHAWLLLQRTHRVD